jgi:adenylate kinase family enzyme
MTDKTTLIAKKPTGVWNKEINFNFKNLFKSLSEGAIAYFSNNNPDLIKSTISLIEVVEFKNKPEVLLYSLIIKSFQQSITELINENFEKLHPNYVNTINFTEQDTYKELLKEIDEKIEEIELVIGIDFFSSPTNISILEPLILITKKWFEYFGFGNNESINTSKKISSYFIYFLNDNWRKNSDEFQPILKAIITPFAQSTKVELEWKSYHSLLVKQTESPVFNENFGLKDIFIDLYGYYEVEKTSKNKDIDEKCEVTRNVVDVADYLNAWIAKPKNNDDAIKVISGGPGSGKSTFAKIYAANIASKGVLRVIYIPLQHFNVKDDLSASLSEYLKESDFLEHNPLELIHNSNQKLLLIFDGLDELSKQGRHANELAKEFVFEIQRKVNNINRENIKLYVVLTGRELVIQNQIGSFRNPHQVLNLLPYYNSDTESYTDPKQFLDIDLRDIWWNKYSRLKGLPYSKFPLELKSPRLDEITAQPLLNYLVALTYERNVVKFDDNTNLNEIFQDLIKAVFDRQYEKKQHQVITELNLSEGNFLRVLEEIAVSAWHSGDIRTTTIHKIEKHIENNSLGGLFKEFQLGAQAGITRLLTAFYFRQKGIDADQNKTFEFTHKSFGEYLASRRIVSTVLLLSKKINENDNDPDEGRDRKSSLKKILELLGVMPIDNYLYSFISNEIKLSNYDEVVVLQKTIISLIEFVLFNGMPVEQLTPRPDFKKEMNYYRNSLLSLFIFLKVSSDTTKEKSTIKWPTTTALGEIISLLNPQKSDKRRFSMYDEFEPIKPANRFLSINTCLTNLVIKDCYLASSDLTYADFSGSHLTNVVVAGCDLFGSVFIDSILEDTNFYRANMQQCYFKDTTFVYATKKINMPNAHQLSGSRIININGLPPQLIKEIDVLVNEKKIVQAAKRKAAIQLRDAERIKSSKAKK